MSDSNAIVTAGFANLVDERIRMAFVESATAAAIRAFEASEQIMVSTSSNVATSSPAFANMRDPAFSSGSRTSAQRAS